MATINWNLNLVIDTAAVLYQSNPTLLNGQVGTEMDTGLFKIGDGTKKWNDIAYATINNQQNVWIGLSAVVDNLLKRNTTDGGFELRSTVFANNATLNDAVTGSAAANALDADVVKSPIHRIGVLLRNIINAMGTSYTNLKTYGTPTPTLQERIQTVADNAVTLAQILKDTVTATNSTWSSTKIDSFVKLYVAEQIAILVGDAPEALDTIYKLAAAMQENDNLVSVIANDLGNTVRFNTAQNLNSTQKAQARTNIGAADAAYVGAMGDAADTSLVDVLNTAMASSDPVVKPAYF